MSVQAYQKNVWKNPKASTGSRGGGGQSFEMVKKSRLSLGVNTWRWTVGCLLLESHDLELDLMNALESRDMLEHEIKGVLKKPIDAAELNS